MIPLIKKIKIDKSKISTNYDFICYIYDDLLSEALLKQLHKNIANRLEEKHISYRIHGTTFNHNGSKIKIAQHKQNARDQQPIHDLSFEPEWWYQSIDTVKEWSDDFLSKNINPAFYRFLQIFYTLPPFSYEAENWIPYRMHANVLKNERHLALHNDGYAVICKNNFTDVRMMSVTFYFEDYVPEQGGDFQTIFGFSYKPKRNSAIALNGNQITHGVSKYRNPTGKPRLAFSTRWIHKEDLYLPGHPDKALYKPDLDAPN